MRSRLLAPILVGALLALPGCGIVKGAVKRSLTRFASGTIAAVFFGSGEAAASDEDFVEEDDTSLAEDEASRGGFLANAEGSGDDSGGTGFYKVVEANGTVRFVSNLSEVPTAQRPDAERLDMPVAGSMASKHGARSRAGVQQLASARSSAPDAATGDHEVIVYTIPSCGTCKQTLAWLERKGVEYENRNIESNAGWAEEVEELTGLGGVPVIVIDGEVVQGFDRSELEKLLRG